MYSKYRWISSKSEDKMSSPSLWDLALQLFLNFRCSSFTQYASAWGYNFRIRITYLLNHKSREPMTYFWHKTFSCMIELDVTSLLILLEPNHLRSYIFDNCLVLQIPHFVRYNKESSISWCKGLAFGSEMTEKHFNLQGICAEALARAKRKIQQPRLTWWEK